MAEFSRLNGQVKELPASCEAEDGSELATILVGVDGTPRGDAALRWALDEARMRGRSVKAVYVWPTLSASATGALIGAAYPSYADSRARRVVDESLGRIGGAGGVDVVHDIRVGAPLFELRQSAGEEEPVMTVIGCHLHSAPHDLLTGSAARALTRRSPCPLVVVPETYVPAGKRTIVAGFDGSPASRAALRWAINESQIRGSRLRAVTVLESGADARKGLDLVEEVVKARADRRLARLVITGGRPGETLAGEAAEADLLVLGAPAHTTLHEWVLGSETRWCLGHSTIPVVLVPPEES